MTQDSQKHMGKKREQARGDRRGPSETKRSTQGRQNNNSGGRNDKKKETQTTIPLGTRGADKARPREKGRRMKRE